MYSNGSGYFSNIILVTQDYLDKFPIGPAIDSFLGWEALFDPTQEREIVFDMASAIQITSPSNGDIISSSSCNLTGKAFPKELLNVEMWDTDRAGDILLWSDVAFTDENGNFIIEIQLDEIVAVGESVVIKVISPDGNGNIASVWIIYLLDGTLIKYDLGSRFYCYDGKKCLLGSYVDDEEHRNAVMDSWGIKEADGIKFSPKLFFRIPYGRNIGLRSSSKILNVGEKYYFVGSNFKVYETALEEIASLYSHPYLVESMIVYCPQRIFDRVYTVAGPFYRNILFPGAIAKDPVLDKVYLILDNCKCEIKDLSLFEACNIMTASVNLLDGPGIRDKEDWPCLFDPTQETVCDIWQLNAENCGLGRNIAMVENRTVSSDSSRALLGHWYFWTKDVEEVNLEIYLAGDWHLFDDVEFSVYSHATNSREVLQGAEANPYKFGYSANSLNTMYEFFLYADVISNVQADSICIDLTANATGAESGKFVWLSINGTLFNII